MEQMQSSEIFSLQVESNTKAHLAEAAKWAKFLSIVGFVICGLVVLGGIFASTIFGSMASNDEFPGASTSMGAVMAIFYVIFAAIYFFPCLFLYRFASNARIAINSNSQEDLEASFQNLKACFRFMGIMTIIVIAIYALAMIIGVIAFAAVS